MSLWFRTTRLLERRWFLLSIKNTIVLLSELRFSGVMAARQLNHRDDLEILIVEQGNGLGRPFHTTGGVAKFWLENMGVVPPDECYASRLTGMRLKSDENEHTWRFGRTIGYTLHPDKYMEWLGKDLNCEIVFSKRVTKTEIIENGEKEIEVTAGKNKIRTKYLIAADGPNSIVARSCGLYQRLKPDSEHIGMEYSIPYREEVNEKEIVTLHFSRTYAPHGYVWRFPAGDQIKVGLGIPTSAHKRPKERLDSYFREILKIKPEVITAHGGIIPTSYPLTKPVFKDRIFFTGDAARFCSPLHGGGILQALVTGKIIGEAINKNFSHPKEIRREYMTKISWTLKTLKMHYRMKKLIYSMSDHDFTQLIDILKSYKISNFDPNVEIRKLGWFILRHKPQWFLRILF